MLQAMSRWFYVLIWADEVDNGKLRNSRHSSALSIAVQHPVWQLSTFAKISFCQNGRNHLFQQLLEIIKRRIIWLKMCNIFYWKPSWRPFGSLDFVPVLEKDQPDSPKQCIKLQKGVVSQSHETGLQRGNSRGQTKSSIHTVERTDSVPQRTCKQMLWRFQFTEACFSSCARL